MYTAHSVENNQGAKRSFTLPSLKRLISPLIVLIVGVGLSITAMKLVEVKVRTDMQMEFDKSVSSLTSRTETGFAKQEQVLHNLDGLFKASVQVVRDVFELYSTIPAKSEPGILSIAYANHVSHPQLADLVLYNRSEGNMNYKVYPPGERSTYEPISYVVPFARNQHISGFDLLSNPVFAHALHRASASHGMVSTPVFNFRGGDTASIVLMTVVDKKQSAQAPVDLLLAHAGDRFDGVVYVELEANRFLHGAIGDTVGTDKNIVYTLTTKDINGNDQVAYKSPNYEAALSTGGVILNTKRSFSFGDREFTINFSSSNVLGKGLQSNLSWITLAAGLLLTIALCGFLMTLVMSHDRALNLADKITSSNRRVLELSQDMIATMSQQGIWQAVNPAVQTIMGFNEAEFLNHHFSQFLVNGQDFDKILPLLTNSAAEFDFKLEVLMKTKNGQQRWINWSFTAVAHESTIYCNGRDVTEAKAAEEQIKLKSKQLEIAEQLAYESSEFKSTFMINLTERVRGSLADSLMNLHKISANMDYEDERQLQFLKLANQSSDQMYNIVSDLLEVAKGTSHQDDHQSSYLLSCISSATKALRESQDSAPINVITNSVSPEYTVRAEEQLLSNAIHHLLGALCEGKSDTVVQCSVEENTVESVLEVQMLASHNNLVERMIHRYNNATNNLIDELEHDECNIMFRLGVAASQFRRMNCSITVGSLGEDGNVVMITIPSVMAAATGAKPRATEHAL